LRAGNMTMKECIYGPVPSRRLGRSVGIDVVPYKTCTYDCIYCQLGRTTDKTMRRSEYVQLGSIIAELDRCRESLEAADYVSIAGSGEPTLYARLGELIDAVKARTRTPVAVITNGSLLWDHAVQDDLKNADLVIPSLDAGNESLFRYVNRPHPDISFDLMAKGLVEFRGVFKHAIWLEVLLVGGVTGIDAEVRRIADIIGRMRPEKVQVNTVIRPPAEEFSSMVSPENLRKFAALLGDNAEVIAEFPQVASAEIFSNSRDEILAMLKRRPCTLDDIAAGLGINRHVAVKQIDLLVKAQKVSLRRLHGRTFFAACEDDVQSGPAPA